MSEKGTKRPTEHWLERATLADSLRQEFEATLDARVERYVRAQHQDIIAVTPFAAASAECVLLFRDGHFHGCISLCQAVCEALVRHMCRCHSSRPSGDFEENVRTLKRRGFIDEEFEKLCLDLWKERHAFHHMNDSINIDLQTLEELAFQKVRTLAKLEGWAFEYSVLEGTIAPTRPEYWTKWQGDKLLAFLRL